MVMAMDANGQPMWQERMDAMRMNLELTGHGLEDMRVAMEDHRLKVAAEMEERRLKVAAEMEDHRLKVAAEMEDHRKRVDAETTDIRESIRSLIHSVATFAEAQEQFNRQLRTDQLATNQTSQILARIVARHDAWIEQRGAA